MNNLYEFELFGKKVYVAETTWRKARNVALKKAFPQVKMLTQIRGRLLNENCTFRFGIVSTEQVYDEMAWWLCPNCGANSFVPLDDGSNCRCGKCGKEMFVPKLKKAIRREF